MSFSEIYLLWSESAAISAVVWSVIIVALAYLAREPMHKMFDAVSSLASGAFQQASASLQGVEQRLSERNTEVLIAAGLEAAEHDIEREFERINKIVEKDLAEYPSLHRKINDVVTKVGEDYQASSDVPPEVPGWAKAVDAVANISATKGDPMVGHILESIHDSMNKNHHKALETYRKASRERHMLLKKMLPAWREMDNDLKQVDQHVNDLMERSRVVDHQMERYEQILSEKDATKKNVVIIIVDSVFYCWLCARHRCWRRHDQLQLDCPPHARNGRRQQHDDGLSRGQYCSLGDYFGGSGDGSFLDGEPTHYPPIPCDWCYERYHAHENDLDYIWYFINPCQRGSRSCLYA
ncbi:MAG: hypothetical protein AUK35_08020 [Zetaproteobacteria bacterium CG2_30_46_52]|nr:MAG: hypothetical protein AUK35_08020 [Zetaproteobacteria bacterium CG2_30_46_52]